MIKDNHLGGFVLNGDERTYYPQLWETLINDFNIKSLIDVGCGEGHSSYFFHNRFVEVLAIDGSKKVLDSAVFDPIVIHDYCTGPYIPDKIYDFVWCCEFVEHIEEKYIPNFIATFKKAKYVAFSHALPKQGGYHHVNEREPLYWIRIMESNGFEYMEEESLKYRKLAHDYFQVSGLIFKNNTLLG